MPIESDIAVILEEIRALRRELRDLRAERQHQGGRWGSRAEAARHLAVGLDAVDGMIARGELRVERIGPEPVERRDRLGRRIDRRRVRVWISGPPRTDAELEAAVREARA